jgi:TFIIF-interacting CTD phosphatase-like protein
MYVQIRSGVDEFLRQMGQIYEVVVYTASLSAVRVLLVSCVPRGGIQLMSISFAFRLHLTIRIQ